MAAENHALDKPREGMVLCRVREDFGNIPGEYKRKVSSHPVVGFSPLGKPLIECEDVHRALSVPDVSLVRVTEPARRTGYKFLRVVIKIFRAEASRP